MAIISWPITVVGWALALLIWALKLIFITPSMLWSTIKDARDAVGRLQSWFRKRKPVHGDASFANWKALNKTVHAVAGGWYMGLVDGKRVYTDPEACVIGVAPRRTGKSNMAKAQLLSLALLEEKPDVIVFDPHGDLRPAVLQRYLDEGYHAQFINFTDATSSDQMNPLSYIRTDPFHQAQDCDQLMRLVMSDEKGANVHFSDFPRVVMAGVIAFKLRTDPMNATMSEIVRLMIADQASRARMFDAMMAGGGPIEVAAVTAFRDAGEKERGSFSTTMTRKMGIWLRPNFAHITGTSGFTWESNFLNQQPVVTFITTGGTAIESAAARLLVGNAINTRVQMWPRVVQHHTGEGQPRFPKDLRILIDETRLLGNCEAVVTAITETGKMGTAMMLWTLGLRDVFEVYPEASVIVNSSNLVIFGGGTEMSTYEDISRMIGEYTIENRGYSQGERGTSESRNEQARRVAKSDELRNMPVGKLVAIMGTVSIKADHPVKIVGSGSKKRLVFR